MFCKTGYLKNRILYDQVRAIPLKCVWGVGEKFSDPPPQSIFSPDPPPPIFQFSADPHAPYFNFVFLPPPLYGFKGNSPKIIQEGQTTVPSSRL